MHSEEPEAYRIGSIPFLGLTIYLDSHPLIPRPETEWWVEEFIRTMSKWSGPTKTGDPRTCAKDPDELLSRGAPRLRVLDLCAGSGVIGCTVLAQCPNAQIYFGEIDPAHEATILKNIRANNLDESRAEISIGDLFEPFGDAQFDFIAANPPYVPESRTLPPSVADYEPALALRAGADGLTIIRRIATELPKYLAKNGQTWVECDSPNAEAAQALFIAHGFRAEIHNDQYDRPRLIVISF